LSNSYYLGVQINGWRPIPLEIIMANYRLVSHSELDKMHSNGWVFRHITPRENVEDVIEQVKQYSKKIKVYKTTTAVRGYYQDLILYKK
jgi:hypothetical protein